MPKVSSHLDFQSSSRAMNLPAPQAAGDAVPRSYVDSLVEGLGWKDSCRVSTQSNINLAAPGATIDGITMVSQDRFLVRSQTTASQNGIYIWNGASTPATRALDASTFAELEQAVVLIEEGTSAGSMFRQSQINGTIDSSDITWAPFSTSAPPANETTPGILETATQPETDTGLDDQRAVTPLKLNNWSGRRRKFAASIGDGSATSYTVTHNFNMTDVVVGVFLNSTGEDVITDITRSANAVTVIFATPPASNAYRVVVIG
jgi:hypothetical protein